MLLRCSVSGAARHALGRVGSCPKACWVGRTELGGDCPRVWGGAGEVSESTPSTGRSLIELAGEGRVHPDWLSHERWRLAHRAPNLITQCFSVIPVDVHAHLYPHCVQPSWKRIKDGLKALKKTKKSRKERKRALKSPCDKIPLYIPLDKGKKHGKRTICAMNKVKSPFFNALFARRM